jgi:hypothetical protein
VVAGEYVIPIGRSISNIEKWLVAVGLLAPDVI